MKWLEEEDSKVCCDLSIGEVESSNIILQLREWRKWEREKKKKNLEEIWKKKNLE